MRTSAFWRNWVVSIGVLGGGCSLVASGGCGGASAVIGLNADGGTDAEPVEGGDATPSVDAPGESAIAPSEGDAGDAAPDATTDATTGTGGDASDATTGTGGDASDATTGTGGDASDGGSSPGHDASDGATGTGGDASDGATGTGGDAGASCGANNTACSNGGPSELCKANVCSACTDPTDDSNCATAYAGAFLCLGGVCAPGNCRVNADCATNANGPLCGVTTPNQCGKCTADSQCAGNAAGTVCNTTSGTCVAGTCTASDAGAPAACPVNASEICCGTSCATSVGAHPCCSDDPGSTAYCTAQLGMSATCVGNACTACPAVTNGQYTVASGGSDTTGTGAGGTPGCAFASITRAIEVIGPNPALASTITVAGPLTVGAGETFPITLPTRVTVTTSSGAVTVDVPSGKSGFELSAPNSGITGGASAPLTISGQTQIATYGILVTTGSAASTQISNLTVTSFLRDGILVENAGVLTIGAGVTSTLHGLATARRAGLHVTGAGSAIITVPSGMTPTHFDGNTDHGIFVDSNGSITLTGSVTSPTTGVGTITTSGNYAAGVWVQQIAGGPQNLIDGLESFGATNGNGLHFFAGSNIRVRNSASLGNANNGVLVSTQGNGSDDITKIDLGTAADAGAGLGNNVFQEPLAMAGHNVGSGICLNAKANTGTLSAEGNTFSAANCATAAAALTATAGRCANNTDLGIIGAGNDVDVSLCTH
jgi:hypothetical protein